MLTEPSTGVKATPEASRTRAAVRDNLNLAAEAVCRAPSLALACHVHPDGDALGSLLAMKLLCDANGMPAVCSWPDPFVAGPHYDFLRADTLAIPPNEFPPNPKIMMTFDLGRFSRLGSLEPAARRAAELIVVDHHADNERFGTINVVDPEAAATAVVIRELARTLGWELGREVATCLYAGLVTDTGRFRYPNTTSQVFHLAEELASFDIPIPRIEWELFERHRFAYLRLVGHVLERARLDAEAGFVAAWCTHSDLERFDVTFDETEALIDVIRQSAEAEVSCVVREEARAGFRVSLRSTGSVDVGEIARGLGGGGHWFMAGFQSTGSITGIIDQVETAVRQAQAAARRSG